MRRHNRIAWSLIGLRVAGNVLRSRRSYELMIVGAIMLAALAHQARENQAQILARRISKGSGAHPTPEQTKEVLAAWHAAAA